MPAGWRIEFWPRCESHVFLSHCAEDRHDLVVPVFEELRRRGIVPWIDRHHYPAARESFETLREELLRCRHVVYFITPAILRQGRGWSHAERAFGDTIQQWLRYGDKAISHVELPLWFVPGSDPILQRSFWRPLLDKATRATICPHLACGKLWQRIWKRLDDGTRQWQRVHVQWAADAIESFVHQEERWAVELGERFTQDTRLRREFSGDDSLMRRLLAQAPRPLPKA